MPLRAGSTILLLLLAAGCASTPDVGREGVLVPLAPRAQPVDQLLASLRSSLPGTRASAAWQLAAVVASDQPVMDALSTAYADPDERVSEASAWALGHFGAAPLYDEAMRRGSSSGASGFSLETNTRTRRPMPSAIARRNAWIVSPPTVEGFADALGRLLDDPALHRKLSDGCLAMREQFRRDYGLEGAIAEWRKAFRPRLPAR